MDETLLHIDDADPALARRLCALLAKADPNSGASEAEMEAALGRAQAMALLHRINLLTVTQGKAVSEEPMANDKVTMKGSRRPPSNKYLVWVLCDHFNVEAVYGSKYVLDEDGKMVWGPKQPKATTSVEFLGRTSDVRFAIYAYWFLHRAFTKAWRKAKRQFNLQMSARDSFFYGVYSGLDAKLKASKKVEETKLLASTSTQVSNSYTLAVVTEEDARKAYTASLYPRLRRAGKSKAVSHDPWVVGRGVEAGEHIEIILGLEDQKRGLAAGKGGAQ